MLKNLMLTALLGLSLVGPARAVDGGLSVPVADCKSFSATNAAVKVERPNLQIVKLTAAQRMALSKVSNLGEFDGTDVYTLSEPGINTILLVLVRGDCIVADTVVPAEALDDILGRAP